MRALPKSFMQCLTNGFLSALTETVRQDKDLDFQMRGKYLNVYFKGNSLLKLKQVNPEQYKASVNPHFLRAPIPDLVDDITTTVCLEFFPQIKESINRHKSSIEIEYEQLVVRANNREPRTNSEYYILDRQYNFPRVGRLDLAGFFWNKRKRRKHQTVQPCFMEVKFALNNDIKNIHEQLSRYQREIKKNAPAVAKELETILRQKLELGLFDLPQDRIEAMKTLKFSPEYEEFQFILILVDYNRSSKLFSLEKLKELDFSKQIRIFHAGFAMWRQNVEPLGNEPALS